MRALAGILAIVAGLGALDAINSPLAVTDRLFREWAVVSMNSQDLAGWAASVCYRSGIDNEVDARTILKVCEATWWETGHMMHR